MLIVLIFLAPASATWTVIGIDPDTQEVGVAGATCGPFVWQVAGLSPGHGAVVAQYASNLAGRDLAVERLAAGDTPEAIIGELTTDVGGDFDDDRTAIRQYGVVGFAGASAGFTGAEVEDGHGEVGGDTFRAQGNTLRTTEALDAAYAAMIGAKGETLAERLLRGLEAGRDLGGDARCPEDAPAQSAFLHVASPDDPKAVSIELAPVFGGDPVAALREHVDDGVTGCAAAPRSMAAAWAAVTLWLAGRVRRAGRA